MASIELTSVDLESILEFTVQLAKTAGKLILEGSQAIQSASDDSVNEKKNAVDLVTEYDVRVEELVKKEIEEKYPDFKFIGEESYSAGTRPPLTDEPTYCVDPIGLIYKRRPVLGVIYNPFLDHLYSGVKGQGSYLTRGSAPPLRLPLSTQPKPLPSLSKAVAGMWSFFIYLIFSNLFLVAVEWGSDRCERTITAKAGSFARLAGNPAQGVTGGKMAHSLRSMGSAALNFAMVAQGGLDLYWEIGCWPWDVCAGVVIAQEAGGLVTGSHEAFAATASSSAFGDVTEDILTGRKYVVVRAISGNPGETGTEAQKRIIKEFYESVEDVPIN
ncbi:hypothetical protein C0995_001739 [Termitomyces sp. Mi166|nr:hypothetical protein C0995_001739 [Termitomyces sp. Mi166\